MPTKNITTTRRTLTVLEHFEAPQVEGPIRFFDTQALLLDTVMSPAAGQLTLPVERYEQIQEWVLTSLEHSANFEQISKAFRVRGQGLRNADLAHETGTGDASVLAHTDTPPTDGLSPVDHPWPRSKAIRVDGGYIQIHGQVGRASRNLLYVSELERADQTLFRAWSSVAAPVSSMSLEKGAVLVCDLQDNEVSAGSWEFSLSRMRVHNPAGGPGGPEDISLPGYGMTVSSGVAMVTPVTETIPPAGLRRWFLGNDNGITEQDVIDNGPLQWEVTSPDMDGSLRVGFMAVPSVENIGTELSVSYVEGSYSFKDTAVGPSDVIGVVIRWDGGPLREVDVYKNGVLIGDHSVPRTGIPCYPYIMVGSTAEAAEFHFDGTGPFAYPVAGATRIQGCYDLRVPTVDGLWNHWDFSNDHAISAPGGVLTCASQGYGGHPAEEDIAGEYDRALTINGRKTASNTNVGSTADLIATIGGLLPVSKNIVYYVAQLDVAPTTLGSLGAWRHPRTGATPRGLYHDPGDFRYANGTNQWNNGAQFTDVYVARIDWDATLRVTINGAVVASGLASPGVNLGGDEVIALVDLPGGNKRIKVGEMLWFNGPTWSVGDQEDLDIVAYLNKKWRNV